MSKIGQREQFRKSIEDGQNGRCLLCDYPLPVGCHLHHVIARDDGGPDHLLNLIGLCPNHHTLLECVRRHVAPTEVRRSSRWLCRGKAAIQMVEVLTDASKKAFRALSEPHPLREAMRCAQKSRFQRDLAIAVAGEDLKLLSVTNKLRPRIILACRITQGEALQQKSNVDWRESIAHAEDTICARDFSEIVQLHLLSLKLPKDIPFDDLLGKHRDGDEPSVQGSETP